MIFLTGDIDSITIIGFFIFITCLNIFLYIKVNNPIFMLITMIFTIFFAIDSFNTNIILTPNTQFFFVLFNIVLFITKVIKKLK